MNGSLLLRDATIQDTAAVLDIYNPQVSTSTASWDLEPAKVQVKQKEWFVDLDRSKYPFLVAQVESEIVGYCYVGKFRSRPGYDM
jgi:L-amino acid N-acyltransferase YncA